MIDIQNHTDGELTDLPANELRTIAQTRINFIIVAQAAENTTFNPKADSTALRLDKRGFPFRETRR